MTRKAPNNTDNQENIIFASITQFLESVWSLSLTRTMEPHKSMSEAWLAVSFTLYYRYLVDEPVTC